MATAGKLRVGDLFRTRPSSGLRSLLVRLARVHASLISLQHEPRRMQDRRQAGFHLSDCAANQVLSSLRGGGGVRDSLIDPSRDVSISPQKIAVVLWDEQTKSPPSPPPSPPSSAPKKLSPRQLAGDAMEVSRYCSAVLSHASHKNVL